VLKLLNSAVELPSPVTRALEDERLVFSCGAGISKYTNLPLFRDLTLELFEDCRIPLRQRPQRSPKFCESLSLAPGSPSDIAFWEGKFDRALALLEKEVTRPVVRQRLVNRLSKDPPPEHAACSLHRHLLDLARCRGGGYRLVTTNFDDRFERAADDRAEGLGDCWDAPRIAPPRPETWQAVTFLHGRIRKQVDRGAEDLILTSADFGRAYLQDGWAARFVVELFREYTVLFVGYSVNDAVMTYLVDAIALDRGSGRPFRQPYALADWGERADKATVEAQWRAKNVEPILYPSTDQHRVLHEAIEEWAALHRGGFETRVERASQIMDTPYGPHPDQTGDIDTLVWALSKPDGSAARAVAERAANTEHGKTPHISWLRALLEWGDRLAEKQRADDRQLAAQGSAAPGGPYGAFEVNGYWTGHPLTPPAQPDKWGGHIRCTPLFDSEPHTPAHPVGWQLGRWVVAHLDDPELAVIVAGREGRIGAVLRDAIEAKLNRRQEPLPGDLERFWRIILRAHDRDRCPERNAWAFRRRLKTLDAGPLDWDTRSRLLALFEPRIRISPSEIAPNSPIDERIDPAEAPYRLHHLARFQVDGQAGRVADEGIIDWLLQEDQVSLLAELAPDLGECLARTLRCAQWIEDVTPRNFHRSWLPTLNAQPDASGYAPFWLKLVLLCRAALAALASREANAGSMLLRRWSSYGREPWGRSSCASCWTRPSATHRQPVPRSACCKTTRRMLCGIPSSRGSWGRSLGRLRPDKNGMRFSTWRRDGSPAHRQITGAGGEWADQAQSTSTSTSLSTGGLPGWWPAARS